MSVHSTLVARGEPLVAFSFSSLHLMGNKDAPVCKCGGLCEGEIVTEKTALHCKRVIGILN